MPTKPTKETTTLLIALVIIGAALIICSNLETIINNLKTIL